MKFSFVIGTLDRSLELRYCIDSLLAQDYKDYEIIIVDQSKNDLTEKLVASYGNINIIYKHVDFRGLSKARNFAINIASGDYICLTDDDASYSPNYLSILKEYFANNPYKIISGYMWDAINKRSFIDYSKLHEGKNLSVRQIIRKCPSPAITFNKCIWNTINGFDEEFGVGAKYGAGEETDFLLRAKWAKYETVYRSDVKVNHPHENAFYAVNENAEKRKAYNYPFGIGAMYRKQFTLGGMQVVFPYCEQLLKNYLKKLLHKKNAGVVANRFVEGFNSFEK